MYKRTVTQKASDLVHEIQDMVINDYFASHLTDTLTDDIIRLCHEFDDPFPTFPWQRWSLNDKP